MPRSYTAVGQPGGASQVSQLRRLVDSSFFRGRRRPDAMLALDYGTLTESEQWQKERDTNSDLGQFRAVHRDCRPRMLGTHLELDSSESYGASESRQM